MVEGVVTKLKLLDCYENSDIVDENTCIILNIFKLEDSIDRSVHAIKTASDIENYKKLFRNKLKFKIVELDNLSRQDFHVDPINGSDNFFQLLIEKGVNFALDSLKCLVVIILSKGTNDYFLLTDGASCGVDWIEQYFNNKSPRMKAVEGVPKIFIFQLDPIDEEKQQNILPIAKDKYCFSCDSFLIHHFTIPPDILIASDELVLTKIMLEVFTNEKNKHIVQLMLEVTNKLTIAYNKAKQDKLNFQLEKQQTKLLSSHRLVITSKSSFKKLLYFNKIDIDDDMQLY